MNSTNISWTDFKNFVLTRNSTIDYVEFELEYQLCSYNGQYSVSCIIEKGTDDSIEFETSYMALSNLPVINQGVVSVGNTTSSTLLANAVYLGAFEEIVDYAGLTLSIFSDKSSASSGLKMQWSHDGINVDKEEGTDVVGGSGRAFNISRRARYFRVKYTNGAVDQTLFRVGVVYGYNDPGTITRPIGAPISDNNFAQLNRSVIAGKQDNGTFSNIGLSNSGNIKISVAESINIPVSDVMDGGLGNLNLTIGTTAVEIKVGASARENREVILVYNNSFSMMYIGSSSVTTTTGVNLGPGDYFSFKAGPNTAVYLIAATAGNNARIIEAS